MASPWFRVSLDAGWDRSRSCCHLELSFKAQWQGPSRRGRGWLEGLGPPSSLSSETTLLEEREA